MVTTDMSRVGNGGISPPKVQISRYPNMVMGDEMVSLTGGKIFWLSTG